MQLRTLRLYIDTITHRSFSKAASLNGVSQSLVSQAITSLETRVGAKLIDRSKRPPEPTRAGVAYADGCRQLLEGFQALEDSLHRLSDKVSGKVRLAAIYSVGLLEMGLHVEQFRSRFPDVEVRMDYLRPEQVYERVQNDEADLGIVSFPREGGEFRSHAWQEQEIVLIAAPGHSLATKRSMSPQRMLGLDFIMLPRDLKFRRMIDRWLKGAGVSVNIAFEFDNVENIKRSVEIGLGVALLPRPTVQRELDHGSLCAVSLRGVDWKRKLGIVQRRNKKLTIAATRFVEFLLDQTSTQRKRVASKRGDQKPRLLSD